VGKAVNAPDPEGRAVQEALDRILPVLTAGMSEKEAGQAKKTCLALLALRAARLGPAGLEKETELRMKRAGGLSLDGRRRMLQEEALALELEKLSTRVSGTALRVLQGELEVNREVKKETRRTIAQLGKVNATLVGRFPNRTDLLEQVSDSYLDAMFILGEGKGPAGTRLQRIRKDRKSGERAD
jgi:hypothetical protein